MSIKRTITTILIAAIPLVALGDLNILAIGDSHTTGETTTALRSSYRPYLDQSIRNFQSLPNSSAANLTVNWLGTKVDTAHVPTGSSPIAIDGTWSGPPTRDRHQAVSGISSLGYANSNSAQLATAKNLLAATPSSDDNLALIFLGTNDFGLFENPNSTSSVQTGWTSSRFNPTEIVDSIMSIVNDLQDVSVDPDLEVLIAAIPPVDERRRYTVTGDPNNLGAGNLWNESDRTCTVNNIASGGLCNGTHQDLAHWDGTKFVLGPGADAAGAPLVTDSNDIIAAVNDALQVWASGQTNVGFVDPFDQSGGYQLNGTAGDVNVDGGGAFNLVQDANGELEDLADGLHLTAIGDQYYASAFWEQGVRLQLSESASAQAVPEPSSFLFLGWLAMLSLSARRYFRR